MNNAPIAVIVDDDQDIRELLAMILRQSGYEVHSESGGIAGVEAVRRHHPSLVTVDIGLPDINGFEVTEQIRLFSDSHVIMLTARVDKMDTLRGMQAGANEFLAKPFRPRELRARVDAILGQAGAGGDRTRRDIPVVDADGGVPSRGPDHV